MKKHFFVSALLVIWAVFSLGCKDKPQTFTDLCGHELPALEAMDALTGNYVGKKLCNGVYSQASQIVCRDPDKTDHLLIDGDAVLIDLSCECLPNPSIYGYRWYVADFTNDSLFLYKDQGSLGNPDECRYYLKKE